MSPIKHETVMYDVEDAAVRPVLTDVAGAAAPTYGPTVDVPGIAEVGVDPNLLTAELKGDGGRVLAKKGKIDRFNFSATYGKLALQVLKVIMGGSVLDSGVTPNQKAVYELLSGTGLPYFGLEFVVLDVDLGIGDLHVVLPMCQLTGGTLISGSTDSFGQPSLECEAFSPASNKKLISVTLNESPVAVTP